MSKSKYLHVYSENGGLIVGNVEDLEIARRIASTWAEKNVGRSANIFTLMESHICEVAPLKIIPAEEVH